MRSYKAVIFDLDDTLLNRNQAVDSLFSILLESCYEGLKDEDKNRMLKKFKEYDKNQYGNSDKIKVFEPFFNEFPTVKRLPGDDMLDFWNTNFPHCFSINPNTLKVVNAIKMQVEVAIITNGVTHRQRTKIKNTNLNDSFDKIIISEEVGFSKPDERIFKLALKKLNLHPEEALFVGDELEKDIGGCQNANIKGIWFNPHRAKNHTGIKPYAEIDSLDKLLSYLNG